MTQKNTIFYHIHNPGVYAQLNFQSFSRNTNWVMMVREPTQSCESWANYFFRKNNYAEIVKQISHMLNEIDNPLYQNEHSVGIRLEDLKVSPQKVIPTLCEWLGIKEENSLYEMTAQGKKWWAIPQVQTLQKMG